MKIFKVLAVAFAAFVGVSTASAQDKLEGSVGADVVSRYVWRGQSLGDAAIQPSAGIAYKGLSFGFWGSYGFLNSEDSKEFDLTLAYTVGGFNIGVTDYWFSNYGEDNKYFEYRNGHSTHVWEGNIGYDFGPIALQWYTNFAGDDGLNKSFKRAYSSYFQISAPFKLVTCDWTGTVGIVPWATDFYTGAENGFAVTNLALRATKTIPVCKSWGIPVFGEVSANPATKKGYFVVGLTLAY